MCTNSKAEDTGIQIPHASISTDHHLGVILFI